MRKYSKIRNIDRVHEDAKQMIYYEGLKGYCLMSVIGDWVTMNSSVSIMEGVESRGYKPNQLLLVKEIKAKLIEIVILINKLEE